MITKRVNRYYCDHCGKSGGGAAAMKKHETHCTMNPRRRCRVCDLLGEAQEPVEALLATLPRVADYEQHDADFGVDVTSIVGLEEPLLAALPKLRDAANDCPACMLAAFRQAKIPAAFTAELGFDYKAEMKKVFDTCGDEQWRGGMGGDY